MGRWLLAILAAAHAAEVSESMQQEGIMKLLSPGGSQARAKTSQMEDMVLLLAQQAKAAREASKKAGRDDEDDLKDLVRQVREELKKMQDEIFVAANESEAACHKAYDNLAGCPVYGDSTFFGPKGFNGDFKPLRDEHEACRETLPQKKQDYISCHKIRESLVAQEQALLNSFRAVSVFKSPDECLITGTDVLAYLKAMRDHFGNAKIAWWKDYYDLENVTKNITQWNCTEMEVDYFEQLTECQSKQEKLEQIACEVHERTNESCHALPACYEGKWSTYTSEVQSANSTFQDLKYEYRAIKRIMCLLDAFVADDLDEKIEECMAQRHSAAAVHSACVENHAVVSKPAYVVPGICKTGVTAILHPDHPNFNETEYASKGIRASKCLASCCTVDWYSWGQYGNVFVPESHIMVDEENQKATYDSISEAKQACEALGSVQCFGIYDAHCDGATAAKPLVLVASPGLDLNEVEESSVGSCIYHMEIGSGTTTTTTVAEHCTWELAISHSELGGDNVWKTLKLTNQRFDEAFRFSGCDAAELPEASACTSQGKKNGVRLLKTRRGQAVATGACCDTTTNKVIAAKRTECDGFLDAYTKYEGKYLTSTKMLRGTSYSSMADARSACLRKGTKCWGLYDDKCDGQGFVLVDAATKPSAENLMTSNQGSCIYEKLKA